jgi:hypothetical protein
MSDDPYDPYSAPKVIDNSNQWSYSDSSKMWLPITGCVALSVASMMYAMEAKEVARDAQTHLVLLRLHVDQLRNELDKHGIKPPDLPEELKQ